MKIVCIAVIGFASLAATLGPARAQTGVGIQEVRTQDVFVGQNKPGPYLLAFKNFRADNVEVIVDGKTLEPTGYVLDVGKGEVSFRAALKTTSIARVDYSYDPLRAVRNANPSPSPLTFSLAQAPGANLQVTALPGSSNNDSLSAPRLVWGLGGKMSLLGGGLTSQVLLGPEGKGSFTDRAGVKLGYGLTTDRAKVDMSFLRSGADFAPAAGKTFGLAEQAQRWSLGAQARPTAWLAADVQLGETRDLSDKGGASERNALALKLFGNGGAPALNVARTESDVSTASGAVTETVVEKVDLSGKLGTATTYTAQGQRTVVDGPKPATNQTKEEASLSIISVSANKTAQASLALRTGTVETASGVEERQGVQVKLQPAPMLTVTAEAQIQTTTPTDITRDTTQTSQQTATAELKPFKSTRIVGSFRSNEAGDQRRSAMDVSAETQALRYMAFTGGITSRGDTSLEDAPDTQRLSLTLRPKAGWSLTGGLTINPENKGVVTEATRQEFGLAGRLGALEMGGGYARTTLAGDEALESYGLQSGEFSLNLGLRFSRFTQLKGSYKDLFFHGADDPRGSRLYALGLTHNLGSLFNLSLGGSMAEDKSQVGAPADVKAEAKIGLKF